MDYCTFEEMKKVADQMELDGVDFLDPRGAYADDHRRCARVRISFIDGRVLNMKPKEFQKADCYYFRLRPERDNA